MKKWLEDEEVSFFTLNQLSGQQLAFCGAKDLKTLACIFFKYSQILFIAPRDSSNQLHI